MSHDIAGTLVARFHIALAVDPAASSDEPADSAPPNPNPIQATTPWSERFDETVKNEALFVLIAKTDHWVKSKAISRIGAPIMSQFDNGSITRKANIPSSPAE